MNVESSDGTLILARGQLSGGTALTRKTASQTGKPYLVINLVAEFEALLVEEWLAENRIRTLNVAGPRESQQPGIQEQARDMLRQLFQRSEDQNYNGKKSHG